jgi:hypothetical protein
MGVRAGMSFIRETPILYLTNISEVVIPFSKVYKPVRVRTKLKAYDKARLGSSHQ